MKTPFRKRTINLILASTIALTPFAANLAFAPNAVHASGIEDITAVAQSKIYKNLTSSDVADIKVAYNNISKANFSTILGQNLINKIDAKTSKGTAIILAKDIAKLLYQTNSSDFKNQLEAFKKAHIQIFEGKLSSNDVLSILNTFEDNLKLEIINSYVNGGYTNFDQLVTAAINDTQKQFSNFDGLYQELGITVTEFLTMKTNLEKAVDPTRMASAALSSGLIRSEGGNIYGASTATVGNTAPSYSFTAPFIDDNLVLTEDVVWKTNNSTIATFTGNKLIAKKAGKVKVVVYYLNQPIITKEITINPDKTAPAVPTVYTVDDNDTVIKGQAEAGSTITVKNSSTTVAIGKTATNRTFSISMKAQKAGSTLYVTAKDAAGNVSKVRSIKVLDRTAPAAPTVSSVDNNDKTIKGKAEAYSYITIKNGKTTIATGKTSSKGTFSFKIKTAQKAGSTLYVTAKDAAGNISKAKATKVLDRIAPAKPRVNSVHSNDKVVRGTAEAGSTIIIKKGSKVLGTGKTSSNGNYSVKIKAQKKGTVLSITAKDKSNNNSSARVISVIGKR